MIKEDTKRNLKTFLVKMANNKTVINIFQTADLHIGLRFKNHPEASETLAQVRYDTLE